MVSWNLSKGHEMFHYGRLPFTASVRGQTLHLLMERCLIPIRALSVAVGCEY